MQSTVNTRLPSQRAELVAALPEKQPKPVAVLVLGMHRAGSSAITRFLNFLGCKLPHTLLDANPTNPAGHWESDAIRAFNDDVLAEAGSSWSDWLPMHAQWAKSQTYQYNLQAAAKILDAEFGDAPLFVLKDPRICRLASFWYEVLAQRNIETVTLIPLRNPLEVAASLFKRDRMDPSIGQLLWLRHVLDAEFASRGHQRMFTHYEELLDNWSGLADRLGEGLKIVWPRSKAAFATDAAAFLSHDLRHHVRRPADVVENAVHSRWLRDTYAILLRWITCGEDDDGRVRLDAIRQAFNETGENFIPAVTALSKAHREIEDIGSDRHGLALRVIELTQAMDNELGVVRDESAQANGALASTQTSLDRATQTVALLEAKLQSTKEELARAVLAQAAADNLRTVSDDRIAALDAGLDEARHQMKEADLRLDSLSLRITQADAEILHWQNTAEQLNAERQTDNQEIESLRASLKLKSSELEMQARGHGQQIVALHNEMQVYEARNAELSILHAQTMERTDSLVSQLQDAQAHVVLQNDHIRFLRETLRILARPGRWWLRLVPTGLTKAIKDKTLQREGLFDADSYRNHYPDVADASSDPLLHYVSHGLEEGRLRT